jgi:hypothetical protein
MNLLKLAAGLFSMHQTEEDAINVTPMLPAGIASPWEAAPPVLLNTWKHHAAALRRRVNATTQAAELSALAGELVVIGNELMDLYLGTLTPAGIGQQIVGRLTADRNLALEAYRAWVQAGGGYRLVDLSDTSRWVLRLGDEEGRYVHVHPGRYSPQTRRVRANVLKTAVMVLAYVRVRGGEPMDVALVNNVRRQHLALAPIGKDLAGDQGLGAAIAILCDES